MNADWIIRRGTQEFRAPDFVSVIEWYKAGHLKDDDLLYHPSLGPSWLRICDVPNLKGTADSTAQVREPAGPSETATNAPSTEWLIDRAGQRYSCPDLDTLRSWTAEGRVPKGSMIYHSSLGAWKSIDDVLSTSSPSRQASRIDDETRAREASARSARRKASLQKVRRIASRIVLVGGALFVLMIGFGLWLEHSAKAKAEPFLASGKRALAQNDWRSAAIAFHSANAALAEMGPAELQLESKLLEASALAMTGDRVHASDMFLQVLTKDPASQPPLGEPLVLASFKDAQDRQLAFETAQKREETERKARDVRIANERKDSTEAENEYVLVAGPAAAGASISIMGMAEQVKDLDGDSFDEYRLRWNATRKVVEFFCAKYEPSTVPSRFRDADAHITQACTMYRQGFLKGNAAMASLEDPDFVRRETQSAWELLNRGTGEATAALSEFQPLISERHLRTRDVMEDWTGEFKSRH